MAAPVEVFSAWLSKRLSDISDDIDVELFVSYITGILEEDDTPREDKLESLSSFLVEVVPESDVGFISESIIKTYETHSQSPDAAAQKAKESEALDERFSRLMVEQKQNIPTKQEGRKDNVENKKAILAQYAEISDGEQTDSGDEYAGAAASNGALLQKNTNASKIDDAQRQLREQMKTAHDTKKDKDKQDRERQKQVKQEKADKAKQKTQKQERRR